MTNWKEREKEHFELISDETKQKIRGIVGTEHVLDSDLDRFVYSYDASFLPLLPARQPDLIVRPLSTEEISRVLALANELAIPVTPRGAASGRTGGAVPLRGGISLCLDRMKRIIELDEKNMMVTAEAGVRTSDLHDYCARCGLFYPPDPASWKFSTLGGNVAENAGGMRAVKYGVTGNYIMGLEVVLADGRVLETGGKAVKNVTGYDLTSLFTGSEGTLGVITKAILRLIPMPKRRSTLRIMFASLDDCCQMVQELLQTGFLPAAAEIMDQVCLRALTRYGVATNSPLAEACILIEIDGESDENLALQSKRIAALALNYNAMEVRVAMCQQESDELWAARRSLSSAVAALAPNRLGEDISVPRSALPEMVRRIRGISDKFGLTIAVYGHAGDGNLHPSILCDLNRPDHARRVSEAVEEIFAAALQLGGTLSGEHGIGITKRPYLEKALGAAGLETLKAIKQALDPRGILNPGKIWPEPAAGQ